MKFTLAFLAFATTAVNAGTLRTKVTEDFSARHLDTKVALKGVLGEPSAEDMDIIGQALVASYNDVYWQAGHYMTGNHETESLGWRCTRCRNDDSADVAEKQEFEFAIKTPVSWRCTRCRNDDAAEGSSLLATPLTNDCAGMCHKEASAELEAAFCNKILSSGSDYLKSANHCSIQFEHDKAEDEHHLPAVITSSDATIDTTLILKGVAGDVTSQEDLAVIAKAYVSAYNDVHWNSGHYMSDAEIPFSAGTPLDWRCTRCRNDDSVGGATTLVLDIVTPVIQWRCTRCRNDDAPTTIVGLENDEVTRKAVEAAFCKKLQSSVSDKLRDTEHCVIAMETVLVSNTGGTTSA